MMFNVDKCKVMHVGNSYLRRQYFMHGQKLDEVTQERDLGVIISNDLKVSLQCQHVYSKASKIMGLISLTIKYRHTDILLWLYKSLVRPTLCCSSVSALQEICHTGRKDTRGSLKWFRLLSIFRMNLLYRSLTCGHWKTGVLEQISLKYSRLFMDYRLLTSVINIPPIIEHEVIPLNLARRDCDWTRDSISSVKESLTPGTVLTVEQWLLHHWVVSKAVWILFISSGSLLPGDGDQL